MSENRFRFKVSLGEIGREGGSNFWVWTLLGVGFYYFFTTPICFILHVFILTGGRAVIPMMLLLVLPFPFYIFALIRHAKGVQREFIVVADSDDIYFKTQQNG